MNLPAAPEKGEKFRILLVEDDSMVLQLMALHLSGAGFTVISAHDGVEGWQKFQSADPHLVLTDLVMPRASGQQLCTQIRLQSAVPIVVMTGQDSEDAEMESLKVGADDYVTKGANPKILTARVVANLRRAYRYGADNAPAVVPAETAPVSSLNTSDWPTCQNCGYLGPGDRFRNEDSNGQETLRCPACGGTSISFPLG